jgi:hypothetical protein
MGEAVEAFNYKTYLTRSRDAGFTWEEPMPLLRESLAPGLTTHTVRTSVFEREGLLIGLGALYHRDDPNTGLVNRVNLGLVKTELFLIKHRLGPRGTQRVSMIQPALSSPGFEVCHPIICLRDGRWLAPVSTWKGWHGEAPEGMKAVALVSHDKGKTWPEYIVVADQYARGVISWEQSIIQLADDRLLAVVWSFNEGTGRSEPTRYTLSHDGKTFSPLMETGLLGQTAKLLHLGANRFFMAYRREDEPGLWGVVGEIDGDKWVTHSQTLLWQGTTAGMTGRDNNANELSALKFGYPSMARVSEDEVMLVFWCKVDDVYEIRWIRISGFDPD